MLFQPLRGWRAAGMRAAVEVSGKHGIADGSRGWLPEVHTRQRETLQK